MRHHREAEVTSLARRSYRPYRGKAGRLPRFAEYYSTFSFRATRFDLSTTFQAGVDNQHRCIGVIRPEQLDKARHRVERADCKHLPEGSFIMRTSRSLLSLGAVA